MIDEFGTPCFRSQNMKFRFDYKHELLQYIMLLRHVTAACSCCNQALCVTVNLVTGTFPETFVHYLCPSHYLHFHYS
jgi:hypothetical protein